MKKLLIVISLIIFVGCEQPKIESKYLGQVKNIHIIKRGTLSRDLAIITLDNNRKVVLSEWYFDICTGQYLYVYISDRDKSSTFYFRHKKEK